MGSRHKQLYEDQAQGTPLSPPFAWTGALLWEGSSPPSPFPILSAKLPVTRDNQCNCRWLHLTYWRLDWLLTCQYRLHRHMHVSNSTQPTPPFVEDYQNHMDLRAEQDSKVRLLAWATNQREIQFYDNHTCRYCATDSMQKYIWETNTFLGQIRNPPWTKNVSFFALDCWTLARVCQAGETAG